MEGWGRSGEAPPATYGVTVSDTVFLTPKTHALIVTVVAVETADVFTLKDPLVVPAASVTAGAVGAATAVLLLVRLIGTAPGAAGHSSVTVPATVVPPRTGLGDRLSPCARIGRTVRFNVCETPPKAAVTVPEAFAVTAAVEL